MTKQIRQTKSRLSNDEIILKEKDKDKDKKKGGKLSNKINKDMNASKTKLQSSTEDPALAEWREMIFRECDLCPFGCLIVNHESRIDHCNEKAATIFKYEASDLLKGDINSLVPPDMRKEHFEYVVNYFSSGNSDYYERALTGYTKNDKTIPLTVGLMIKRFGSGPEAYCVCYVRELEMEASNLVILPDNPFYIGWILFMFVSIAISMILLPYEAIFNVANESKFMNYFIYTTTLLDIMFNFNCAFVDDEAVITDTSIIARNYIMTYFLIDLQTGIPVEFILFFFPQTNNTLLMIFKLLRSLKLVKYYYALTNDYMIELLSKNPIFKQFKQFSNRYYLYYEAFLLLSNLLIIMHFLTSLFILVCKIDSSKNNWLYNSGVYNDLALKVIYKGDKKFVYDAMNATYIKYETYVTSIPDPIEYMTANPFSAYIIAYYEVSTAILRFKPLECFNQFEYYFTSIVSYFGLFFIAYTIGRLSELLTENYKDDFQYQRVYAVIYNIVGETYISGNIIDKLLYEIKNNYEVFIENKNTQIIWNSVPRSLYVKMQTEYYQTYLESHKLLQRLPIQYIPVLERYSKPVNSNIIFEMGKMPDKLFFITKGEVMLRDQNGSLAYEFDDQMLAGFYEFQAFIQKNFNILEFKKTKIIFQNSLKNALNRNISKYYKYNAFAEPNSKIFYLSFQILEDLIRSDQGLYNIIESYVVDEHLLLSKLDHSYTAQELEAFKNSDELGFIYTPNGGFYAANPSFQKIFSISEQELLKTNFEDLFRAQGGAPLPGLRNFTNGRYELHVLDEVIDVDVTLYFKTIVITRSRVINFEPQEVMVKRETCFLYCRMLNSVKAFMIGKQKACRMIPEAMKTSITIERDEEADQEEQQRQAELYDIMIEMATHKLEVEDIRGFIREEKRIKEQIEAEKKARAKKNKFLPKYLINNNDKATPQGQSKSADPKGKNSLNAKGSVSKSPMGKSTLENKSVKNTKPSSENRNQSKPKSPDKNVKPKTDSVMNRTTRNNAFPNNKEKQDRSNVTFRDNSTNINANNKTATKKDMSKTTVGKFLESKPPASKVISRTPDAVSKTSPIKNNKSKTLDEKEKSPSKITNSKTNDNRNMPSKTISDWKSIKTNNEIIKVTGRQSVNVKKLDIASAKKYKDLGNNLETIDLGGDSVEQDSPRMLVQINK